MAGKTPAVSAPTISQIFKTMEYGPAREDDKIAKVHGWLCEWQSWLVTVVYKGSGVDGRGSVREGSNEGLSDVPYII